VIGKSTPKAPLVKPNNSFLQSANSITLTSGEKETRQTYAEEEDNFMKLMHHKSGNDDDLVCPLYLAINEEEEEILPT
jgi:hypothetical protein